MNTAACQGSVLAAALVGAWRTTPPPLHLSGAVLAEVAPRLSELGQGGLAWWRLRGSGVRSALIARRLRDEYRQQTLNAADGEARIRSVVRTLRDAGVEPILVKGWSAARHYAEAGLRPYGDIDLCVPPGQMAAAAVALNASPSAFLVDLHDGLPDLSDRPWQEAFDRSTLVRLGDTDIRVLGPEDHLRLVALHAVRHGLVRPLWLCDLGAALEAAPADFDWDYCLGGRRGNAGWVLAALGLAWHLLDARIADPRIAQRAAAHVPRWLVEAVLWRWGVGRDQQPFSHYLRHPAEALTGLFYHGLNPIKATFRLGLTPRCRLPMLPVQLAAFLGRKLPMQLARQMRKRFHSDRQACAVHRDDGF